MKLWQSALCVVLLAVCLPMHGKKVYDWVLTGRAVNTDASVHTFEVRVDSIDFRDDLTRLYGRFTGTPHVAIKVMEAVLTTDSECRLAATDSDGFELDRYFQFEEIPSFNIELDFAATRPAQVIDLTLITAKGVLSYKFGSKPNNFESH